MKPKDLGLLSCFPCFLVFLLFVLAPPAGALNLNVDDFGPTCLMQI